MADACPAIAKVIPFVGEIESAEPAAAQRRSTAKAIQRVANCSAAFRARMNRRRRALRRGAEIWSGLDRLDAGQRGHTWPKRTEQDDLSSTTRALLKRRRNLFVRSQCHDNGVLVSKGACSLDPPNLTAREGTFKRARHKFSGGRIATIGENVNHDLAARSQPSPTGEMR